VEKIMNNATLNPAKAPMGAPSVVPLMTAEEFFDKHEHDRVELVRGVVQEVPMPETIHGYLCAQLARFLGNFAYAHDLGRVITNDSFIRLSALPDTVRGPDVYFVSYGKLPKGKIPPGMLEVAPELVVEVRSQSDTWTGVIGKVLDYLASGVTVVVVVNPSREAVAVYRSSMEEQHFSKDQELVLPDVLPGFTLRLNNLFE
jgi:Uma2 family endonuclease